MLSLLDYEVTSIDEVAGQVRISCAISARIACPHCRGEKGPAHTLSAS